MTCAGPNACAFEWLHRHWQAGDLDGFLALCDDDIVWTVNLDGIAMPYAASALGREDLRWRLQHLRDVFEIHSFELIHLTHGTDFCRSRVQLEYIHRATRESLCVVNTFTGWQQNGTVVRMEERVDAGFVGAYDRFIRFLRAGA